MDPRGDGRTETTRVAESGTTVGEATHAEPLAELVAGERIGRYVVRALLGKGAIGAVYRAWDPDLDRQVAIKVLQKRRGSVIDHRALLREAQALARLSHPNVIAIYDVGMVGDPGDALFIAMELVEGTDLAGWLAQRRTLPEILEVFEAAARGLAAAHAVGIVHRDFKPANVLLGARANEVRVADFGLARMQTEAAAESTSVVGAGLLHTQLTATGFVVGTPAYMAPEVHAGKAADAAADQYAFFVALFEAIYGRRPFVGSELETLVARKRKGLAQLPDDVDVPAWLGPMLLRGLLRDPTARFDSLATVADTIARHRRVRGSGRWVVIAAGLAVVGTAAIALALRPEPDRCAHVDAIVTETWNRGRADALVTTIAAHGDAIDGARVRVELDDYASRWREAYRERCDEVPELGKVPWQQLDAHVRCLRHEWLVFDALVRQLETGDATELQAIARTIAELPTPNACADARERPAGLEPPPEKIVAVEDLRARLDAIETISIGGRYREALTEVEKLEAEAAPLGFAPLRIEILATRGYLHDYLAEYDQAAALLEQVVYEAESLGYDHLHARALRTLLYVMATHQGRVAEAKALLPQADALVRRLDNPAIEAELAEAHAIVALYDDDLAGAEQRFRDALVLADGHYGPESRLAAQVAQNLGNVLLRRSRPGEAEPFVRRSLDFHRRQHAPGNIAAGLALLGITQLQLGRYREAIATQREVLAIREELLGPDHPRTIGTVHNLTMLALALGDLDGAEAYGRRELAAIEGNETHPESARAVAYLLQGRVALVRGDWKRSQAMLELALVHAGERGPGSVARLDLATIQRSCGRFDAARASIERERATDSELGESVATVRTYDVELALVELAREDAAAAESRLRDVIAEIADDTRIEVRQVLQRATVLAANAARRAGHCEDALRFATRATALALGDEGDLAWWRTLAWAESAAAKRCLGDREGAERDLLELRADGSAELHAAQLWWDLRVPDVARAWAKELALDPWIAAHTPACP